MGFTHQEVADRLGYCQTSVRKLTQRAMTRLRREAADGLPPPETDLDLD
jgi:DNA-directed RNA polymerase specialized sigma24 family protein